MKAADSTAKAPGSPALKHPGRWLWLLLLVPVIIGLARLRLDVEVFDLLPSDLPVVRGLKLYQEHFSNARELIILIQAQQAEQAETAARSIAEELRSHTGLVSQVTWQPPWLEHPDQAAELVAYLWLNQPPHFFGELTNALAPDKLVATLAATREQLATSMSPETIGRLSYDPYGLTKLPEQVSAAAPGFGQGQELFSSADGLFRVVFVQARDELRTYKDCARWLESVKAIAAQESAKVGRPQSIVLSYTGRPAFVSEISSSMQRDMTKSILGTAGIIAVLFWLAHRRIKPMLWLLALLGLILASTLGLGALIFGPINVVSMGFAGILLGLAVDYAVVHYQEALAQPTLSIPQIRHVIAPSIFWAAVTTISAFLALNLGGLPGLAQLGTLVGLGVALAALIMIFEFLPPLFRERRASGVPAAGPVETIPSPQTRSFFINRVGSTAIFAFTALVVLLTAAVLVSGLPRVDASAAALRPRNSPAYAGVELLQAHLGQKRDPMWVVVGGNSVEETGQHLKQTQAVLASWITNGVIGEINLPTALWPQPQFQSPNKTVAQWLANEGPLLRQTALTSGFTEQSMVLTEHILTTWRAAAQSSGAFWPTNPMSQWIFEKIAARTPTNFFALGMLAPSSNSRPETLLRIQPELPPNVWLSGWELLGASIFGRVKANFANVLVPMIALVLLSLYLAFRRVQEIFLSLCVLGLSGLCLLSIMRLAGWSWNLLNLMAVPLVLGTGVDYSIFMQLALRRHEGDLNAAHLSVGRALLLCGGTALAGFGSLGLSSNAGMASLGQVCAVGIGSNMLIAIFLLPRWWQLLTKGVRPSPGAATPKTQLPAKITDTPNPSAVAAPGDGRTPVLLQQTLAKDISRQPGAASAPSTPSSLYRSELWRLGLGLAKVLPTGVAIAAGSILANTYWLLARHRRRVVIENLAPAFGDDLMLARQTGKQLHQQFARKVLHLWRYEAGLDISGLFGEGTGWEHFKAARAQNRGVLLVTPHLGNWEFGGPMLTSRGVALQVLTLAEPGRDFTQLRQASRARWQIETLVVGNDPLAFVEIIKRLEGGAAVALLIDRPPPTSAVTVQLFGRCFEASIAAAELARASGCALLPVYIPWQPGGYTAHMLPAVPYERATLRDRSARQQLTQQMMTIFEPIIRQYLDQWYHFVPIWPNKTGK